MEQFIRNMFADIIENPNYDEVLIDTYFSTNYIQIVDNLTLDFNTFKKHIQLLKNKVKKQVVKFDNIMESENYIFTKHIVESTLSNGGLVIHKVFAEFEIKDGKIIHCDEATILISGNQEENKLGSET